MGAILTPVWALLERRSPVLFLGGGGLLVGHAVTRGLHAFTELPAPPDGFGPAGFFLIFGGLLGLYPALVTRAPWMARAVAVLAAVTAVDYALILVFGFGELAGVTPQFHELVPATGFFPIHQGVMLLAYVGAGLMVLRTDAYPRRVGALLLAPPVLILAMVAGMAVIPNGAAVGVVGGCGLALVHFAIGASLGPDRIRADRLAAGGRTAG